MSRTPRPARPASLSRRTGRHLRRALGARHEPLVRPLDRSRSRAWVFALLGALLAVALSTGGALLSFRTSAAQADRDQARLHRVDAVVLDTPDHGGAVGRFTGYNTRVTLAATWSYPAGTPHTGTVEAPSHLPGGTVLPIWVDPAGNPASAPLNRSAVAVGAACIGTGALLSVLALLVLALRLRLQALARHADRAWTASWARHEPLWTGRPAPHREDS
ncbi:DUF3592 domain-containing protein [Kitasatospora sp. NPDC051170]|uniref:Rv1733c family protein n=1 Tax=Kitasatospora sp. NPDC051170 TaxID=3364056 RepID=UPI0037B7DE7C